VLCFIITVFSLFFVFFFNLDFLNENQILKAEDIPGISPTTFGYSLSAGLDMDLNDYPDLMVGAYEDDRVFLIRSRPIIGILTRVQPEENLKNIDPNTPGCEKYPNSTEVW
jgi:hypothetical protein